MRYVDIQKLIAALGDIVCQALPGMYPFPGCDTVEALAGRDKQNPMRLVKARSVSQDTFCQLGEQREIFQELNGKLEAFICHLYGSK